jgi:hypothetical protein
MKEAILVFAALRELPPPSWWANNSTALCLAATTDAHSTTTRKARKGDTRAIKDALALYERIVREPPLEQMNTITVRFVSSDGNEFVPGQNAKSVRQSGGE